MLKRLDDPGGINRWLGLCQRPIQVEQISPSPTLKQCPQFCPQHFVDVITLDLCPHRRISKWKFKRDCHHRTMRLALGDVSLNYDFQVRSRLNERRNCVSQPQHSRWFHSVADGQFEIAPRGLLRSSEHTT